MRLLRLEFEGIGSFAEHMEVDFAALADSGLFLIEGPTGSGKSTILDAIVFALYGSVAGSTSDDGRLDSHLRQSSPFVQLDFAVGGEVYRVRRSPAHERRKRRGEGTTSQAATASLVRLGDDVQTLATRASEVGEHINRIVGLTKKQFVATIVLAQGEFAAFLDADTGRRAQILEKVFGTEFYKEVEDQLQSMRQEARRHRAEVQSALDAAVHECIGVLDAQVDPAEPLPDIDRAITLIEADLAAARQTAQSAEEELAGAQARLSAAEGLLASQRRKQEADARLAQLESRRPAIEQWRQSVAAHERAMPVMPVVDACAVARDRLAAAADDHRQALARWSAHGVGEPGEQLRKELEQTLAGLLHPQQVESGLAGLRSAAAQAAQAQTQAEQALAEVEREHRGIVERQQAVAEELQLLPDVAARLAQVQQELNAARMHAEVAAQLRLEDERLQQARRSAEAADAALADGEKAHEAAQQRLRLDHAADLAQSLSDGQPCLVCGSASHPDPARPTGPVDAAEIQVLGQEVRTLRDAALDARALAERLAGTVEALASRLPAEADSAKHDVEQLQQEHDLLLQQAERREDLRGQQEALASQIQQVQEQLAQAAVANESRRAEAQAAQDACSAAEQAVTQARGEFGSVAERVAALEFQRDLVDQILQVRVELATREAAVADAARTLSATLESTGFADEAQVLAGRLEPQIYEQRSHAVQEWQQEHEQVSLLLGELADVDLAATVDIEAARAAVSQAQQCVRQAQSQAGMLADRLARATPHRRTVATMCEQVRDTHASTEAIIRMADFATASRSEVMHKIRLSSFVLMRRFEDVVNAANDRLDTISEGRYQLVVESHGLDNRGQAGLDLRVYDGRSDSCRSTGSLSGGERFYVSLALALGLADVVRGESGGVELGTLFIDEGFGSLDPDVLDEVMDMLEQVRVGEDRVIGLISHVDTLKQRIDPRISVRRDPKRPGVSTLSVHA